MRIAFWFCISALLAGLTSCVQHTTLIKLKKDGSGTLETTTTMKSEALAQMKKMAAGMGGEGKEADLFKESDAKDQAGKMGEGVTFVSAEKIKTPESEGLKAVYAFKDIGKLKISQMPSKPGGGMSMGTQDEGEMAFKFAPQANGNGLLTVVMGKGAAKPAADDSKPKAAEGEPNPMELQMAQQMFKGMKVAIAVEVEGGVVKTNCPYVEGSKVTLLEMDFDALLSDPAKLREMMNHKDEMEAAKKAFKDIKGCKVMLEPEVSIEFGAGGGLSTPVLIGVAVVALAGVAFLLLRKKAA